MSIIGSNILAGASGQATGYNINNSLRFRASASAYLSRTPASATNRSTWTWSAWIKRGTISASYSIFSAGSGANITELFFTAGNILRFYDYISSAYATNLETTQVFRDPSAWYHIIVAYDTTQATAANRVKLYVNGSQITSFGSATYPSQNYASGIINSTTASAIGGNAGIGYLDGYLTENNFVDGTALTPSSFGETSLTTGSWIPKKYTSTYGTNGFYLKGRGTDNSGNGNNWTENNFNTSNSALTTYDIMLDVPTNTSATVGNYAVLNPLEANPAVTVAQGNLSYTSSNDRIVKATMSVTSGKWYWEFTAGNGGNPSGCGAINPSVNIYAVVNLNIATSGVSYLGNGNKSVNGTATAYGSTFTTSDIIGVALDLTSATNTITFYKNNTSQGAITLTSSLEWCPAFDQNAGTNYVNFGQRPFSYTPPTGFVALNTYNLPTPTILQGNKYMDATLYTQNGLSTNVVTNASAFKPDLVWIKCRSNAGTFNNLVDSVRGASKALYSNSTSAEGTDNFINTFNSNGFTLNIGDSGTNNTSGRTQVAWQWQAGQGTTSSNTSGSITSTVSVSTTAGFSVVTYTGTGSNATVGHGLGVAPKWIVVKARSAVNNWPVYHINQDATPQNGLVYLDATNAYLAASTIWNNTAPTSTTFAVGTSGATNASGVTFVAYCWAEIAGFSKFGSYTGNGSTDGPFVATNFKPKFILIKVSSTVNGWVIYDTMRDTYNYMGSQLYPHLSNAEAISSSYAIDALSNGFKIRTTNGVVNDSGQTFIYACFASNPFKNSNAV